MIVTGGDIVDLPPYTHERFVNRVPEKEKIIGWIRDFSNNMVMNHYIFYLMGHSRTGKSWLLKEVRHEVEHMSLACPVVYFQGDRHSVADLLKQSIATVGGRAPADPAPLDQLTDTLVGYVDKRQAIFLLDEFPIHEKDDYEKHFLLPLILTKRAIIIMIAQDLSWQDYHLRLYQGKNEVELLPFTAEFTKAEIEKQCRALVRRADLIHQLSGGVPGHVISVAGCLAEKKKPKDIPAEILDSTYPGLLTHPDYRDFREIIRAVSVLSGFMDDDLGVVLSELPKASGGFWNPKNCTWLKNAMLSKRIGSRKMISFVDGRWFRMDETLRYLLEQELFQTNRPLWKKLHCAMYQEYKKGEAEIYQTLAQYHAMRLSDNGFSAEQCSSSS